LGTPSALVGTNITGTAAGLTAGTVTTNANLTGGVTSVGNAATVITNANLTGDITSVGNATTLTNAPVIAKVLTGYVSGAGTVAATDSILQAIQKLNGNNSTNANLTGPITSVGNATSIASQTGTGTKFVVDTSPTLVTPDLGTPTALVGTNITGTATAFTASNVTTNANLTGEATSVGNAATLTNSAVIGKVITGFTSGAGTVAATDSILQAIQKLDGNNSTNANLTGPITSVGNATSIASQTGTGTKFVVDTSPTLITPDLGTPTALVGTNITGTAAGLTAGTVTTNANLTGEATSVGNTATLTNSAVIGKVITGFTSGAGVVAATDTILQAIQKLNGNTAASGSGTVTSVSVVTANGLAGTVATPATTPAITLTTSVTGVIKGNGTALSAATSGTDYSLGTSALTTGIVKSTTTTGALTIAIAADFPTLNQSTTGNAATVTTNANLTGMVTSVGNAASLGSFTSAQLATALTDETGSGANVFATSPTLVTPLLGTPTSGVLTNCTGLPVAGGGTGVATTTAYGVLAGGTTATGAFQNIGTGTAAQVLTSNGAGALPTFQAASGGVTTFNGSTTGLTPATATSGAITLGGTLAVANGGTGVTTSTGTGATVRGTSPTLVTPVLGTPASGNLANCTGVVAAALPAGTVLQVVSATKTDTSSFTSATFADIGSLTVTITPRNTSSKFLVVSSVGQSWVNTITKSAWRLMRDATLIAIGDAAGSRIRVTGGAYVQAENYVCSYSTISYLDSPATASAVTYKCQASNMDSTGTVYVNRANIDTDNGVTPRSASSITVFEIAG
jgi:hypothetical protein